ncbi:hypothetical protein [Streptomyces sp. NPDC056361]|uniref:hypothetical protein n=1 Tax=Streptomyces sp. NPDC056361 TaxID=3345795 RepID=UPI0035E0331E
MYDSVVAVPRLLAHYGEGAALPHPALVEARETLDAHYDREQRARRLSRWCRWGPCGGR